MVIIVLGVSHINLEMKSIKINGWNVELTNDNGDTLKLHGEYEADFFKSEAKKLRLVAVGGSAYRYPMSYDQPCQIDCRVTSCKFYKGAGKCENVSPAITLNKNGKFVCWSKADR